MPHLLYISLGTNLGNRFANLAAARRALEEDLTACRASAIYETPPWGYTDQPAFLNQVLEMETDSHTPQMLLKLFKETEARIGRTPSFRYGPRLIDIDLLFYDQEIIHTPDLIVPHPRLAERAFVLVPLANLNPDLCHPVTGQRIGQLLAGLDCSEIHEVKE